jgi:hypothetical protein
MQVDSGEQKDTAGLALEYNALRDEILKRIELRQQFLSTTLTIAGIFLGVGVATPTIALVYPPLAAFLAIAWMHNDDRIKNLAIYIRRRLERSTLDLGWETYIQQKRKKTRMRSWRFIITSHAGIFMLTQLMAVGIGLLKFTSTPVEWVLLGFDLGAVLVVVWVIRSALGGHPARRRKSPRE